LANKLNKMSESEDENETFCYFGKPLDQYDEDVFPKKRPITVEEQIATDAQGRRRFHGAFTGGFSAGFFNTVGSLEGWKPHEFKSSRLERAKGSLQKPEDFMDEEDIGEYGIAPQVVKATNEYDTTKKRKRQVFSDGPIPGEPVLHTLLTSGNETVGYMLLKNLGIKDKVQTVTDEKIYGCQMPYTHPSQEADDLRNNQYEIPKVYKEFFAKPKNNTFGLGYVGLDKNHFSLFPTPSSSDLVITDKNNKKMSIKGQAFGVGAFEDDDEDIYVKEDMTRYDFELTNEKKVKQSMNSAKKLVFNMFVHSKMPLLNKKTYPPPQIPHSFTGKYKVRRSRFEPIREKEEEKPSTSRINPIIRARYLGEETDKDYTDSKSLQSTRNKEIKVEKKDSLTLSNDQPPKNNAFDIASLYLSDKFVSSSKQDDVTNILEPVQKMETTHGTDQMKEAVRMKMFGGLTRITTDFTPCALLCKRFNVPEPFVDRPEKSRTRTKNIIFEYQKHAEEEASLEPGLKIEKEEETNTEEIDNETTNSTTAQHEEGEDNSGTVDTTEVKTETTEAPLDITDKIDVEKQQDLFKAVFLSSDSESESEEPKLEAEQSDVSKTNDETRKKEMECSVLSDQLIPKIKPMKEGILSGVNFHKFSKPQVKVENGIHENDSRENEKTIDVDKPEVLPINPDLYGPSIPTKLPGNDIKVKDIVISSGSDDEWIEIDKSKDKKGHKKSKKHKKDKKKKHKHEKKKKYRD